MKIDIRDKTKKINQKLKDNIIKNKESLSKVKHNLELKIKNFFDWVKGAELVELEKCDTSDDPVRPELNNEFRTSYGRKIFGVKYQNEIHAVMCFAFTNEIPKTVDELDRLSKDAFLQSAYKAGKRLIGISANTIKPINNFVWGIFNYGEDIVESLDDLKTLLEKEFGAS